MRRVGDPPKNKTFDSPSTDEWMFTMGERMNVYSGTIDPTTASIPENQWIVYRNTTSGEVRLWTKIAGTLKKSAAFT